MKDIITDYFENHKKEIGRSINHHKVAIIDIEELSEYSTKLSDKLLENPSETISQLELSLNDLAWVKKNTKVRIINLPKTQEIAIRNLRAKHLDNLICIKGSIRRASEVRPQATVKRFECSSCSTLITVIQTEKEESTPSHCTCGRKGGFKELNKDMIDTQVIVLEENSEDLDDMGTQPRRMNIFLSEDLVDPKMERRIIPGSRVQVIGILKEVKMKSGHKNLTRYDLVIEANNIIPLEEDINVEISEEEKKQIKELSVRPDLIDFLSKSIAPSVCGYMDIKKALVFQLFGGVKRKRSDGSFCREQIHGLLVGDPGVAKSIILKYLTEVSYKGRYLSGKSVTGCGITATAVFDEFSKTWVLEAGAMVLANNGSIFIDELEKMGKEDRSNLHEGLSLGTISIAKASVQATLQSRTSVLAAANPKYGRFDETQSIASQINLEASLLSRFDFIFVMRDIPEETRDDEIANKIISEHNEKEEKDILEIDLFKKYVSFAKKLKPKLTKECTNRLKKYYVTLRKQSKNIEGKKVIPLGARQLEGLIRFAEAAAKIRLQEKVTLENGEEAIEIMESYLRQVGYDKETESFDIDKIAGNSTSNRNKIDIVKLEIKELTNKYGNHIETDVLMKTLSDKMTEEEFDEIIDKIVRSGDAFRPKRGIIQLM